jgi:hypothetical protein
VRTPRTELERRAYVVLSRVYYGIHHVPGWSRRKLDGGCLSVSVYADLAAYDYDSLTRLVVAAHDECVRLAIVNGGPRQLKLWFSRRARPGYGLDRDISEAHPTMERAIERVRSYRWLVDVPRQDVTPEPGR